MMFFKKQTAETLRCEELRAAEIDLIDHHAKLDYYEATTAMLRKRINRLRSEGATSTSAPSRAAASVQKVL